MASTLSNSTLTVTVTEKLTLNGRDHGSNQKITITGVNEVSKRILTCAVTPGTQIYAGGDAASYGTFVTDNVKYIRIANLDDANSVVLHLSDGSAHHSQHLVAPGQLFFLTDLSASFDAAAAVGDFTGVNIVRIDAMSSHASEAVDIEVLVASA